MYNKNILNAHVDGGGSSRNAAVSRLTGVEFNSGEQTAVLVVCREGQGKGQ